MYVGDSVLLQSFAVAKLERITFLMPIVAQSASHSYCPLLALPAPRIAGLLPAVTAARPPDPPTFLFSDTRLVDLSPAEQKRLFGATQTLLEVTLSYLSGGKLSDHALNTALALFRRAVTGQPMQPMNPPQYNAEKDVTLLRMGGRTFPSR